MFVKRYTVVASALLLVGVTFVGTLALTHTASSTAQSTSNAAAAPVVRGLPDFTELVEQVGPSVVNIRTSERIKVRNPLGGGEGNDNENGNGFGGMDPRMLEFLRRFGFPIPNMPNGPQAAPKKAPQAPSAPQEIERPTGVGSGFILSPDGFIMTNAHVVEGATDVLVTLTDKREFKAKIIGRDKRTDVAVVKIETTGLPAVKLGDVARLKVGEWVMAIGSPFGLENSVTAGIVSAKARDTGEYLPFIQTDVAINPGNSGGPLINMRGEVVGINSQIVTRSGGYNGVSLSIPIDEATRVADQLRAGGRVARGRIGVEAGSVSAELAESIGLTKEHGKAQGALVGRVIESTPAAKAGIEPGDIILKFDGKPIEKSSDLPRAVGNTKPGTTTAVHIYRRGKNLELSITVAEMEPDEPKTAKAEAPAQTEKPAISYPTATQLGLTLADLTEAQKKDGKLKSGAAVISVEGFAATAGLRAGDVIVAIANNEVSNAKDAENALRAAGLSKPIAIQIRRGERGEYILIKPIKKIPNN
ncbi:MAG: Do family serine endopeptidase [Cytophagales bacterium]|nr:Do family serine endopeptidase [Cytophagales bacterium]